MSTHAHLLADLHWLLTSPSLIAPSALPRDIVDGNQRVGDIWWQSLQGRLNDLTLPAVGPAGFRLGRYAEGLMGEALARLPQHQLIASQVPIRQGGVSLGEYDFLLAQTSPLPTLHIELAVKFFIALPVEGTLYYVGPALRDSLEIKLAHLLQHQLRLSQTAAGRAALPLATEIQPMAWVRGRMFYPAIPAAPWSQLARDHLRGWWRRCGDELPNQHPNSTWRVLTKPNWLAPDTADSSTLSASQLQDRIRAHFAERDWPMMVAEYAPADAGGTEIARGMLLPANWPDPARLAALRAKIHALAGY